MDEKLELKIKAALDSAEAAQSAKELKAAMRELNTLAEQVGVSNAAAYNQIKQAAGEASLKVKEMMESTKALAGTPLQQTVGSFHLIQESLTNMNFGQLTKSVSLFTGSVVELGKALWANPLMLIAGIIILLITQFDKLKDMGGLVGKVFSAIGNVIHAVVAAITAFTDAIGLTDIAGQKATERRLKNIKLEKEALENRYDFEKKAAEATGGNVELIEGKKLNAQQTAAKQTIDIYEKIKSEKGRLTDEETEKYNEALQEYKKIQDEHFLYVLEINKKILDSENEAQKKIAQAQINAISDETEKKKAQAKFDADEEIKEVKKTQDERLKTIEAGRKEAIKNYEIGSAAYVKINHDAAEAVKKILDETNTEAKLANDKKNNEIDDANTAAAKKAQTARQKAIDDHLSGDKKISESLNKLHEDAVKDQATADANAKKSVEDNKKIDDSLNKLHDDYVKNEQAEKAAAKQWYDDNKKIDASLNAVHDKYIEDKKKETEAAKKKGQEEIKIGSETANALTALNDLITQTENQNLKKGEKASVELQKKQFERGKALGLVNAIINVAQGVTAALSQPPPYSFIMAALTGVTGAISIAKIASQKFNPDSSDSSSSAGSDSTPTISAPSIAAPPSLSGAGSGTNFRAGQFFGIGTANQMNLSGNNKTTTRVVLVSSDVGLQQAKDNRVQVRATLRGH